MGLLKVLGGHWPFVAAVVLIVAGLIALAVSMGPVWLAAHWDKVLDALIVVVMGSVIAWLYVDLEEARAQTAIAEANYQTTLGQVRTLQASNGELASTVRRQSDAASRMQAAGVAASRSASEAMARAATTQANDQKTIAQLRSRIANPKTNQGSCDDEIARLRAGV